MRPDENSKRASFPEQKYHARARSTVERKGKKLKPDIGQKESLKSSVGVSSLKDHLSLLCGGPGRRHPWGESWVGRREARVEGSINKPAWFCQYVSAAQPSRRRCFKWISGGEEGEKRRRNKIRIRKEEIIMMMKKIIKKYKLEREMNPVRALRSSSESLMLHRVEIVGTHLSPPVWLVREEVTHGILEVR